MGKWYLYRLLRERQSMIFWLLGLRVPLRIFHICGLIHDYFPVASISAWVTVKEGSEYWGSTYFPSIEQAIASFFGEIHSTSSGST